MRILHSFYLPTMTKIKLTQIKCYGKIVPRIIQGTCGGYMIKTLEEALNYIAELEAENQALREEVEHYRSRNRAGRKKHDDTWQASYNDFVVKYEGGMSIMEIVNLGEISRRTAYRYKAYYDELRGK